MNKIVFAPFNKEQVKNLNEFQNNGRFHPFTCINNSKDNLIATEEGWHCPNCDYTQNWAHNFMIDNSLIAKKDFLFKKDRL